MAAINRISAKDVLISVIPPTGTLNAKDNILGGAEEMTVSVTADNEEAYQAGNYFPVEIVDGKKHITGSLTKAYLDVETLNKLFPADAGIWPSFDIEATLKSGKTPGRKIKISGAKFDSFDVSGLGLDGYAKNVLPFKATNWKLTNEFIPQ